MAFWNFGYLLLYVNSVNIHLCYFVFVIKIALTTDLASLGNSSAESRFGKV